MPLPPSTIHPPLPPLLHPLSILSHFQVAPEHGPPTESGAILHLSWDSGGHQLKTSICHMGDSLCFWLGERVAWMAVWYRSTDILSLWKKKNNSPCLEVLNHPQTSATQNLVAYEESTIWCLCCICFAICSTNVRCQRRIWLPMNNRIFLCCILIVSVFTFVFRKCIAFSP